MHIIQWILPFNCDDPVPLVNEKNDELIRNYYLDGDPKNVSEQTFIRRIALKSVVERKRLDKKCVI